MPYPPWLRTGPEPTPHERARRRQRARWFSAILSAAVQLPGLAIVIALARHPLAVHDPARAVVVMIGILAAAALVPPWRRPGVIVVAALALPSIAYAPGPPAAALAVAFVVARTVFAGDALWAWCTLAGMGLAGVTWTIVFGPSQASVRALVVTIALCVLAGVVTGMGARRERFRIAAREESARRRSAAEEERLRIARELHDVLAHSLSQISVQAGVGLHLFDDDPRAARETLRSIRSTSVTALDEVRAVLGVLRDGDESGAADQAPAAADARRPGPALSGVAALIDDARASGLIVAFQAEGDANIARVPAGTQSAAYRIAQEALTNVRRHAPGARVEVDVRVTGDAVSIRVQNGRGGAPQGEGAHGGRGILGMRERAAALGGTIEARPLGAGFVVEARLPFRAPPSSASEGTATSRGANS
jgi:signal transduction histidine kinase